MKRDVYSGHLRLNGEEHEYTLAARATPPIPSPLSARRSQVADAQNDARGAACFGESHDLTLKMRWIYGLALYRDPNATLDDFARP